MYAPLPWNFSIAIPTSSGRHHAIWWLFQDCLGQSEDAEKVMQTMDRLSFPILLKLMKSDVVQEDNAEAVFNVRKNNK